MHILVGSKCIHLLSWFDHRNHICLVSELLGMCVYDFLKENDFAPFPRHHIQDFARQLLGSVACASLSLSPYALSPHPPSTFFFARSAAARCVLRGVLLWTAYG